MKLKTVQASLSGIKSNIFALLVSESELKSKKAPSSKGVTLHSIDKALRGSLINFLNEHDFKAKEGKSILFSTPQEKKFKSILVYGAPSKIDESTKYHEFLRTFGGNVARTARENKFSSAVVASSDESISLSSSEELQALSEGLALGNYQFTECKSSKKDKSAKGIQEVQILSSNKKAAPAFIRAAQIAASVSMARDLVNRPPNVCTPTYLLETCKTLAKKHKIKIEVRNRKDLQKLGANALLAVAKGSAEEAYIITLTYSPKKPSKTVALIGKGITFDSGGLSIKPSSGMEGMKIDMAGAAAVIAAMDIIASVKPDVQVKAYIPTCENMIGPAATRVGDVVTSLNGKTIEILNTDAEGRLILCDAIALAKNEKCDVIIDIATLTGAVVSALGMEYAGFVSSSEEVAKALEASSKRTGEKIWRLPLAPEYKDHIKSKVADIKNTGRPSQAGSIIGGLFLHEFSDPIPWAHIDIAGTADTDSSKGYSVAGGTGFGARLLADFIINN